VLSADALVESELQFFVVQVINSSAGPQGIGGIGFVGSAARSLPSSADRPA
jgi:hypothetical protein